MRQSHLLVWDETVLQYYFVCSGLIDSVVTMATNIHTFLPEINFSTCMSCKPNISANKTFQSTPNSLIKKSKSLVSSLPMTSGRPRNVTASLRVDHMLSDICAAPLAPSGPFACRWRCSAVRKCSMASLCACTCVFACVKRFILRVCLIVRSH